MQSRMSLNIFRFVAGFASIYHLLLGLVATFASAGFVISIASSVYGITINIDPNIFISLARFVGSYMIAFGLMMGLVALKPTLYRNFAWVAVILFALRLFDRLVFFDTLEKALNITWASSIPTIVVVTLMAVSLIIFMPKKQS